MNRKNLSVEEAYQRKLRLRHKFKACIRLIIANVAWLQELEDENLSDNVNKNIAVLTRKRGQKNLMTLADKAILNQPPEERSEEEQRHLRNIFAKIKCFKRYPPGVIDKLPGIAFFQCFGPNRTIIKQGYEPMNMYVILSGEVIVSQTYYSSLMKEVVTKDIMVMAAGTLFGELALLYNMLRTATVKTVSNCEFIYFKRDDFHQVLRPVIMDFYSQIELNLSWFDYFRDWSSSDIREACILSNKKYYQKDQIVLAEGVGHHDFVHFVTSGSCCLTEHILIKTLWRDGKWHEALVTEESDHFKTKHAAFDELMQIYDDEDPITHSDSKYSVRPFIKMSLRPSLIPTKLGLAKTRFMRVCSFNRLACFNVGESLKNRLIIAETDLEILLLPKFFLDEKSMLTFKIVQQYLSRNIPGTREIFNKYLEEKRWSKYKENLTKQLTANLHKNNDNNIANVPYTIRLGEDLGES